MALIKCPNCGNEISESATQCPHCQFAVSSSAQETTENSWKESNTVLSAEDTGCPDCGCSTAPTGTTSENDTQPQETKAKPTKKKAGIIALLLVILLILAVVAGVIVKKNNDSKIKEEYSKNLKAATTTMIGGAVDAETAGNLIKAVWANTIFEEDDAETDKYTKDQYGNFHTDFNDSLSALFSDSGFQQKIDAINANKNSTVALMKTLKNPPKEYKDAYQELKAYYDAYLKFLNITVNATGSLNSFSDDFNNADTEIAKHYEAMQVYLE